MQVNFLPVAFFLLEILFADICDPSTKYHGFIEFGNAKLSSNTTINLTTEIQQNVQIDCLQDYCDAEKTLFSIFYPRIKLSISD